jgi:NAD(P)-dependent dehydrogenase (short-subunit alcohol dehydrogenase family)
MAKLDGRVAIVTGGASGIGLEFSRRLARDGAAVVIADLAGAAEAAAAFEADGLKAIGVRADVASEDDVAAAVDAASSAFGGLDILVNNAALFSALTPGPFSAISPDQWRKVMDINVMGPFLTARAAAPAMRRRGAGRIINIASNTAHKGAPGLLHYVTSKAAVIGMTRALARELGPDNITVNALAPGFTLSTGVMGNAAYQETFRAAAVDVRAIRRDQTPQDLVGTLAFLASDDAAFVTGQTIIVDGGNVFL